MERSSVIRRAARYVAVLALLAAMSIGIFIFYSEYSNSRDMPMPSDAELRASFTRASAWVLGNRERLLAENNPMLWLFVRQAGNLSGEQRMLALARDYQSGHTDGSLWRFLFDPSERDRVRNAIIVLPEELPDYNHLFLYGATCNTMLREDPEVHSLFSPSACTPRLLWLRSPWCRTHQLMGLRLVQQSHCEPDTVMTATVASVQQLILTELKWDFRVEDAYIQKVLTLVESGRRTDVKAVWLRRILDAQRADGGWDGVDVIARLPGSRVLCWQDGRLYPVARHDPTSTFHATAQALYLLALLLQK
jgi:hypothetical protein